MSNPDSKKLIAANWKMNLDHIQSISFLEQLLWYVKDADKGRGAPQICILPSFTSIRSVQTVLSASRTQIFYGAQDVSAHSEGAFTGEVSAAFLKQLGCSFALVGHSERRANFNETTEISAQKIDQCILNKIDPILCLGESTKVDDQTSAEEVALELKNCINQTTTLNSPNPHSTDVRNNNLHDVKNRNIHIAYEPIWAIGSGVTPSLDTINYIATFIKERVCQHFPHLNPRVLYGGSVNHTNAQEILELEQIDGLLIGSASLDISSFCKILSAACV